jgi:NTE family protein
VAASSNFPIAFTPLTLNSYPGSCNYIEPLWVKNALNDLDVNPRRYYSARLLRTYQEKSRGYIHLLDGGVADNIGLRGPLTSLTSGDVTPSILNKLNNKQIKKLVVIVVDAKNETPNPADQSPGAPDLPAVVNSIATVPLDNYSFDTLELLQQVLRERDRNQRLQPGLHQVEMYRIYIGFDQIKDETERALLLHGHRVQPTEGTGGSAAPHGRGAAPAIALPQGADRVPVGSGATGRLAPVSVARAVLMSPSFAGNIGNP